MRAGDAREHLGAGGRGLRVDFLGGRRRALLASLQAEESGSQGARLRQILNLQGVEFPGP